MARISTHRSWRAPGLEASDQVCPAQRLQGIPDTIKQAQWGVVNPVVTSWQLHQRRPGSTLQIVPETGNTSSDQALRHLLMKKTLDDRADRADRADKAEMTMNEAEISNSI